MMTELPEPASLAELLTAERVRTLDRIAALTRDRDRIIGTSAPEDVTGEHHPEAGTADWERSQVEAVLEQARRLCRSKTRPRL